MSNNDRMYAIERSDEYLAHYGIKGMRWGVRKALASGNDRALARQYRKASRKLAKLQKRATSGAKYARRAAALGAGAAAAGGLAIAGTSGVSNAIRKVGLHGSNAAHAVGKAMHAPGMALMKTNNAALQEAGKAIYRAGTDLDTIGSKTIRTTGVHTANAISRWGKGRHDIASAAQNIAGKYGHGEAGQKVAETLNKHGAGSVSNNTLARAGAAALGAGLAGAAGYNAYRAATTKRAARKAAEFQKAMNQTFKGTQYANGGNGSTGGSKPRSKKRRRR